MLNADTTINPNVFVQSSHKKAKTLHQRVITRWSVGGSLPGRHLKPIMPSQKRRTLCLLMAVWHFHSEGVKSFTVVINTWLYPVICQMLCCNSYILFLSCDSLLIFIFELIIYKWQTVLRVNIVFFFLRYYSTLNTTGCETSND